MKIRKGSAFIYGLVSIFLVVAVVALRSPDSLVDIADASFAAIVGLVTAFSGANVADNFQKSKYYRSELEGK